MLNGPCVYVDRSVAPFGVPYLGTGIVMNSDYLVSGFEEEQPGSLFGVMKIDGLTPLEGALTRALVSSCGT